MEISDLVASATSSVINEVADSQDPVTGANLSDEFFDAPTVTIRDEDG